MSGHSKWNNIKNKKGKEDAKKEMGDKLNLMLKKLSLR